MESLHGLHLGLMVIMSMDGLLYCGRISVEVSETHGLLLRIGSLRLYVKLMWIRRKLVLILIAILLVNWVFLIVRLLN